MSVPILAAKLIELRHRHGYSQQEVADYLDLTREGYSHYERNVREPNLETLVKLSRLYQINIAELVNEETILLSSDSRRPTASTVPASAANLTENLNHLLKLLSGKNISLDLTNTTKEDLQLFSSYLNLDKETKQEIQDFVRFKVSRKKPKE